MQNAPVARRLCLGAPSLSLPAAPTPVPAAPDLAQETAASLHALPTALRSSLGLCHSQPEATERELGGLTHPHGLPSEASVRRDRLQRDMDTLQTERQLAEGRFDDALEDAIQRAQTQLHKCRDRLEEACAIAHAGQRLRQGDRTLSSVLDSAQQSWLARQERRSPTRPDGAPPRRYKIPLPDTQSLEPRFQQALSATQLNDIVSQVAQLAHALCPRFSESSRFAAWFLARVILEARQISAPGINGTLLSRLQNAHPQDLSRWQQAFSEQVHYLPLHTESMSEFVEAMQQHAVGLPGSGGVARSWVPPLPALKGAPAMAEFVFSTPPSSPRAS